MIFNKYIVSYTYFKEDGERRQSGIGNFCIEFPDPMSPKDLFDAIGDLKKRNGYSNVIVNSVFKFEDQKETPETVDLDKLIKEAEEKHNENSTSSRPSWMGN